MTTEQAAGARITAEATSWPGVRAGYGTRGELAFHVGPREIGHIHGDHAAHYTFPKAVWHELYAAGGSSTTPSSPVASARPHAGSRTSRTSSMRSRCCG